MHVPNVRVLLVLCLVVTTVGCAAPGRRTPGPLHRLENSLVFVPTRYPTGNWHPAGLHYENARFSAADGTRLHGWYLPHENPRAIVLFAHGNAGNLSDRAEMLRHLRDQFALTVMTFDYRGFGRSEGSPDESGILQDARAARAWLAARAGIGESEIVLMGRSLGGGVMVDLAAADGARGLILESTFTSLPDAAAALAPWVPARLLMHNRLDSLAKIAGYRGPLLQSHGDADRLIPYEQGLRLFAAANEPKQFISIAGANHNDPQTAPYYRALDEFIARLPQAQATPP